MSKSTYQNMLAQQRRITKRTNLFISQHNKLVNIGMAVFFLLLLFVATGLPSKITRSIHDSKPATKASTISSNAQKATINKKTPALATPGTNQQNTPQQQTGTQPAATSSNQTDCKRTEIPYKTTYQNVSYLQKGQTRDSGSGANGFIYDCGIGKPVIVNPVDKTVYVGTGLTDEEIAQQKIEEYDIKYSQWFATYNNAYQRCIKSLRSYQDQVKDFCKDQASQQAGLPPQQP